jgi:intron-binding protein aquarius
VVALSRSRLGVYVFGRKSLFENCIELSPSFSIMANRPDKLVLALGEQCGAERAADAAPGKAFEVQSLEHIQAVVMQILQERNIQIGQSSTEAMQAMQQQYAGKERAVGEAQPDSDAIAAEADAVAEGEEGQGGEEGEEGEGDAEMSESK